MRTLQYLNMAMMALFIFGAVALSAYIMGKESERAKRSDATEVVLRAADWLTLAEAANIAEKAYAENE